MHEYERMERLIEKEVWKQRGCISRVLVLLALPLMFARDPAISLSSPLTLPLQLAGQANGM